MKIKTLLLTTLMATTTMAKEIKTEIHIQASPEKVWKILTNFNEYPNWNPFIKSIKDEAIVGKKITARIEPPEAKGMTFTPKVLVFNQDQEFKWVGHFLIPGLFDGEHKFELIKNQDGSTTLIQSEKFGGILVPLFKTMIENNTLNGFKQMNQKLKELAETTN